MPSIENFGEKEGGRALAAPVDREDRMGCDAIEGNGIAGRCWRMMRTKTATLCFGFEFICRRRILLHRLWLLVTVMRRIVFVGHFIILRHFTFGRVHFIVFGGGTGLLRFWLEFQRH